MPICYNTPTGTDADEPLVSQPFNEEFHDANYKLLGDILKFLGARWISENSTGDGRVVLHPVSDF